MITSGRHVPAEEAHKLGIVDELAPEGELKQAALAFARRIADARPLPRIRDKSEKLAEGIRIFNADAVKLEQYIAQRL